MITEEIKGKKNGKKEGRGEILARTTSSPALLSIILPPEKGNRRTGLVEVLGTAFVSCR